MAQTRGADGITKPRVIEQISTAPVTNRKPRVKKTKAKAPTKANTGKKRTGGGVAGSKVTKKSAPTKRKTTAKDKVEGAVDKVEGKIEGKPGKVAAGTKKMKGTDGKTTKPKKEKVTAAA